MTPLTGEGAMKINLTAAVLIVVAVLALLSYSGCSNKSMDDVAVDDGNAPAPVTDLAIVSFSDTSVTLSWTASGDDDSTGTADHYELRMSSEFIHWSNFDSASQVHGLSDPKQAGQSEQFEVTGLDTDSTYYFALRVFDENGNYEGVSNCVSATCFNDFVVLIPDADLLAAVRSKVGKPTGDIMKSDMITVIDLTATDQSISDLTGLEYCSNMTILNVINNSISDLSPLSQLAKLEQFHAGGNAIVDLTPLSALSGLTVLRIGTNQIADLSPISGLTNLTELDIQSNLIHDITHLSNLTQIQYLGLSSNRIRDISPLVDNDGLGSGDNVSLHLNPLDHESIMSDIPALRTRGVTVHWVDNTIPPGDILDLTVDTVTASSATVSWTAPGEDFYEGTAYEYELRYSTEYDSVSEWSGGQIVSGVPDPDTSGTTQSVVVSELVDGTTYYFAIRTQDNSENWSNVSNVAWGLPYSDQIVTFSDPALEAAVRDAIDVPSGSIYKSDLASLDTLVANYLGISDLTGLEHCIALVNLNLGHNDLSNIDQLSILSGLSELDLQDNSITDLSALAGLVNLRNLQLSANPLESVDDLSSLHQLRLLFISLTGVSDLQPVSSMTELQFLFIIGNSISDISALSSCSHLYYLNADNNAITDVSPLGDLLELYSISLKSNMIQDIAPLVDNSGVAAGDEVALENNPLSSESINTHIPALQARGVTVTY